MKEKGSQDPDGVLHDEEGDGKHKHLQDPEAGQPGRQGEPRSREGKHCRLNIELDPREGTHPPSLLSPPGPGSLRLCNAMETKLPHSPSLTHPAS